nr:hypothetical protein [Hypnea pseudomusciformis]
MISKIMYINNSLNKLIISIKTFDIYFLDSFKKYLHKNKDQNTIIRHNNKYKNIVNLYAKYNYLCINEFQYLSLIILKKHCDNSESNINSKYTKKFQYIYNQHSIYNKHKQIQKNIKVAIIYIYILNQIQNPYGFYKLIQYFLII